MLNESFDLLVHYAILGHFLRFQNAGDLHIFLC